MGFLPISRMWERVERDRGDADTTAYLALLYAGEMLVKVVAAGLAAAIRDDRDRHRYRQIHRLVRADGLGDWGDVINDVLTGPAAAQISRAMSDDLRDLTQKVGAGVWQYDAAVALHEAYRLCYPVTGTLPGKVDGRRCFDLIVNIRNATRGHGAPSSEVCSQMCPKLEQGLNLIRDNLRIFKRPWAFLHRNLSGKYRVTKWTDDAAQFEVLKTGRTAELPNLQDGVYLWLDEFIRVDMVRSDQDASDFFFPNGKFTDKTFEMISYVTGDRLQADSKPYLLPPNKLPESETQGRGFLEQQGKCFGNLPPPPAGFIARTSLENELTDALLNDRHPVVTLVGSGGIGKTSLALQVLHQISLLGDRFDALIWFSARDIDLLSQGPKVVRPQVLNTADMSAQLVELVGPPERAQKGFDAQKYFSDALGSGPIGKTLYVFDNFETIRNPAETYKWLDTYIRLPNKILITTRFRDFKGDYPVAVDGMEEMECDALIDSVAGSIGIRGLLTDDYRRQIQLESSGHPYVIKILLGEVAKARRLVQIERIVANRDEILDALFERTYSGVTPAARRVFLTLCGWRSVLPQVALEAVLLRGVNERMDVEAAVDELSRSSLVEIFTSESDQAQWVSVPLAASVFGQRKLAVDAMKVSVDADIKILQSFGAAQVSGIKRGIGPRVNMLFQSVASKLRTCKDAKAEYLPILESIARKYPPAWLLLSTLHEELACDIVQAKECVLRYLQSVDKDAQREGWMRLAKLCAFSKDWVGEIHALVELADLPDATIESISSAANRLNGLFREHLLDFDTDEKQILVQRLITLMEARAHEADGVDFSRLAWLCLQVNDVENARKWTRRGLAVEPENVHCRNLATKIEKKAGA